MCGLWSFTYQTGGNSLAIQGFSGRSNARCQVMVLPTTYQQGPRNCSQHSGGSRFCRPSAGDFSVYLRAGMAGAAGFAADLPASTRRSIVTLRCYYPFTLAGGPYCRCFTDDRFYASVCPAGDRFWTMATCAEKTALTHRTIYPNRESMTTNYAETVNGPVRITLR